MSVLLPAGKSQKSAASCRHGAQNCCQFACRGMSPGRCQTAIPVSGRARRRRRMSPVVEPDFLRFDTLSLHAGQHSDPSTGARAVPIYFTTSYSFEDTDHAAGLFNLEIPGHISSRISNPTVAVLEERGRSPRGGSGSGGHPPAARPRSSWPWPPSWARAPTSWPAATSTAAPTTCSTSPCAASASLRPSWIPAAPTTSRPPSVLTPGSSSRRTLGNPGIEVLDIEAVAAVAHERRPAPDGGRHLLDAVPHPGLRARRRHRHALGHQVPGRARRGSRRACSSTAATSTGTPRACFPR